MKTTYPSKVDAWLVAVILATLVPTFTLLYNEPSPLFFLIGVFTLFVVGVLPFTIRYVIADGELIVKWGFVVSQRYDISAIRSIRHTHTALSAPAASLDRLEICFDHDAIIVSPKREEDFISQLQELSGGRIRTDL